MRYLLKKICPLFFILCFSSVFSMRAENSLLMNFLQSSAVQAIKTKIGNTPTVVVDATISATIMFSFFKLGQYVCDNSKSVCASLNSKIKETKNTYCLDEFNAYLLSQTQMVWENLAFTLQETAHEFSESLIISTLLGAGATAVYYCIKGLSMPFTIGVLLAGIVPFYKGWKFNLHLNTMKTFMQRFR